MKSLIDNILISIGGMVGGGIFLLNGVAVYKNKQYAPLAWLIGMIISLLISFSYTILANEFPGVGGTINYSYNLLDKTDSILTNGFSILVIFGYLALVSVYSLGLSNYLSTFMNMPEYNKLFAMLIILSTQIVNYFPKKIYFDILNSLIYGKLILFTTIIVLGLLISAPTTSSREIKQTKSASNISVFSVMLFGIVSFLSYEGFEFISNTSGNLENKDVEIPISFIVSIVIVGIIYSLLGYVTNKHLGNIISKKMMFTSIYNLILKFNLLRDWKYYGFIIIIILSGIANISAINSTFYINHDIWQSFLKHNKINKSFLEWDISIPIFKEKRKLYLWLTTFLSCLTIYLPQMIITNIGSFLFLLIFGFVSYMGTLLIHKKEKAKEKIKYFGKPISYTVAKLITRSSVTICLASALILAYNINNSS